MRNASPLPGLIFIIVLVAGLALAYATMSPESYGASVSIAILSFIVASIVAGAIKVADQWERVVVLRLGKFRSLEGPGLFFIVPIVETVAYRIDTRVITSTFRAEQTMTRDTVPVDVDAVLFWKVVDPKTAALDVADYGSAINWAAQTALRDVIGKTMLSDMLEGRDEAERRFAAHYRRARRTMGDRRHLGRAQGRAHSRRLAGRDVDAGPGRARAAGARDIGRFGAAGGRTRSTPRRRCTPTTRSPFICGR